MVVEKPFGHDLASARELNERDPRVHRRVAAVPDRPLPREDGPRRRSSTCGSRTRCSSRSGTATTSRRVQITMAEDFGVEDRGHFYDPVGALRDVVVNHLMQVVGAAAMEPPAGGDPATLKDALCARVPRDAGRRPGALRARPVRRLPRHRRRRAGLARPRRTRRCAWRSTTGAGRACRSSSAPASACRSPRPSCGSSSSARRGSASRRRARAARARPARRQARPVDRHPAARRGAARRARVEPEQITLDMEFAEEGGEGADALRGAAARRDASATARASPARTASRRRGASCSRCSTRRRRCTRTPRASWGPPAADELDRRPRRAGTSPWVGS